MRIFASSKFKRRYKKLLPGIKLKAEQREQLFVADPFDFRLRTHKLHGKDREHWAYSIDNNYRIKFAFLDGDDILYLDVGTHDEGY